MNEVPILYAYLYYSLSRYSLDKKIDQHRLKMVIFRCLNKNKISKWGFPNFLWKGVIDDMIKLHLISRVNQFSYLICSSSCDKRIKEMVALF